MDTVRTEIEAGFTCLARGDWAGAIRHLGQVVRREAGRLSVVRGLATAYLQTGEVDAARRVIGEFVLANPLSAEGWRLAALLEWKAGRRAEAIRVVTQGLKRLPGSDVLNRQMEVFEGAAGDASPAVGRAEFRRRPPSLEPADADWLDRVAREPALLEGVLRVADAREDIGVLRELARRMTTLLDAQPAHPDRQLALARLQWKIGNVAAARAALGRALAANPHYAEARRMWEELNKGERATLNRRAA
jgi:Flp pilus assembly protein TadD